MVLPLRKDNKRQNYFFIESIIKINAFHNKIELRKGNLNCKT